MANFITKYLSRTKNYAAPATGAAPPSVNVPPNGTGSPAKDLRRYISPVQLQRIVTDVAFLNSAISECESAWYPQRVKIQTQFVTTIRNGQVDACMDRRHKLTELKAWNVCDLDDKPDEDATKFLKVKWFRDFVHFGLEAKAYGYSLITLGDLIADAFPNLSIIKRWNVSPDRKNVSMFTYSISGAPFLEEPYVDWHVWVPTRTDVGSSDCGFGYLYKVALYEIFARNTMSQNSTAAELFGMPIRVGKTNKTDETERGDFEQALANMGAAGYVLLDLMDELTLEESKSLGAGYKIFESLETRCEKKISKIILGHADAMDSTPGKLGGGQDGEESPAAAAMRDVATVDMTDIEDLVSNVLFPKLIKLGFTQFKNRKFKFDNKDEEAEARTNEDAANLATANVYVAIKQAGGDPDWKYFTDRTGIPVEATPPPPPPVIHQATPGADPDKGGKPDNLPVKVKNRLKRLYGK